MMIVHFNGYDAVLIMMISWLCSMLSCRLTIAAYETSGRLISPGYYVDEAIASKCAEQAAVALCYTEYPGLDGLSEYEKHELSHECKKRTERAIYAYISAIRRHIDAVAAEGSQESAAS